MQPILIILEGPNYVGKTFIANELKGLLEKKYNVDVLLFREPGSTEAAEEIRSILFKHDDLEQYTQSLLFTASRIESYNKDIFPALREGKIVITDRSVVSTLVYQEDINNTIKMSMPLLDCDDYVAANKILCVLDADTELIEKRRISRGIEKSYDKYDTDTLRKKYRNTLFAINKMAIPVCDTASIIKLNDDSQANIDIVSKYIFEQIDTIEKEMGGEL
jgi:thymidylate kinase